MLGSIDQGREGISVLRGGAKVIPAVVWLYERTAISQIWFIKIISCYLQNELEEGREIIVAITAKHKEGKF